MPNSVKARKAPKECEDPKVDEEVFKKIRERGRRALTWHNMPKSGILLVTGFRGEGKTALSWWLADTLHQVQGYPRQVVAYGLHPDAMAALPKLPLMPSPHADRLTVRVMRLMPAGW